MNATQLEALVMQAVDAVRAGANPEDDRIEFKRAWPGPEKARQLAATANQAHGDHIIYVIGVDETDGSVHPVDGVDPATWWAQIESRFDEIAPDLALHINVYVSTGEQIVALLFRTDRAPYVVKLHNGGAIEREVPIRAGTRTRSAKRHELIRMLYPAVAVPQLTIVTGALSVDSRDPYRGNDSTEFELSLVLEVLFHHSGAPAFLPSFEASAVARNGDLGEHFRVYTRPPATSGPDSAIHQRYDGIRVAETGVAFLYGERPLNPDRVSEWRSIGEWTVDLQLGVSGSSRPASTTIVLPGVSIAPQQGSRELAVWRWSIRD
ncbi:AlbA family DNA-binding domain-containing protein [Microbacterium sp. 22195]|uniref:AlbA family DNA-binding domain-containing protein n=1 Tax=Microbacterium sp. 22195 TaxID=3453891 RepID=UPI003F8559C8